MSQNLQNFVKFQKFRLENLVDFEKCYKTHIFLQKSEPIQPKTSNSLPKFCRSAVGPRGVADRPSGRPASSLWPRPAVKAPRLVQSTKMKEVGGWLVIRYLGRRTPPLGKIWLAFGCVATDICKYLHIFILQNFSVVLRLKSVSDFSIQL